MIKIGTMAKEVTKYEKELLEIYEIIGFLDSMLAAASYREMLGDYGIPVLHEMGGQADIHKMEIKGLYHPLLSQPVKNDVATDRCMLLTGSNASGKSTFIKAVAVSALFAQTIHTVPADSYEACFYRIYSSMALRDDILSSESYFIVEIKSLRRIFTKAKETGVPVLCFIDEILRGTNTVERVAASSKLLEALSGENAMCFAATHDIELTYLLEKQYANYHFSEHIQKRILHLIISSREGERIRVMQSACLPWLVLRKSWWSSPQRGLKHFWQRECGSKIIMQECRTRADNKKVSVFIDGES